ncbi:MAG: T9SS C-terminal target domain-containing protein [Cytophagales bacterium]|nr:MAG: T9SS C-terminal target domain-containing protein [Cytophagales bacterium]
MKNLLILGFLFFAFFASGQTISNFNTQNVIMSGAFTSFEIVSEDTITFKVYNRWGNVIKTFFDKTKLPKGTYVSSLDLPDLESGVYYYSFHSSDTKKYVGDFTKPYPSEQTTSTKNSNKNTETNPTLYPNPTNDKVNIYSSGIKNIKIIDIKGNILKDFSTEDNDFSMADLTNGTYYITISIENNKKKSTQKIILNK